MATDMVSLIASLYVGQSLPWVLETTFSAHLAVPSLPVSAYCHFRDLSSPSLCRLRLLGNTIMSGFISQRFGGVVVQVKEAAKTVHEFR
jgi:hypothetical protein